MTGTNGKTTTTFLLRSLLGEAGLRTGLIGTLGAEFEDQKIVTGFTTPQSPELQDVLRSLGARKSQIIWKVGVPRAMPYFFAALKVAITLAFVGSVISETVASNKGIGYLMMAANANLNVPLVFAGLVVLAFLGVLLYEVFAFLERRVTFWATRANDVVS